MRTFQTVHHCVWLPGRLLSAEHVFDFLYTGSGPSLDGDPEIGLFKQVLKNPYIVISLVGCCVTNLVWNQLVCSVLYVYLCTIGQSYAGIIPFYQ